MSKIKKICVVINNRANYGRIHSFLDEAKNNKNVDLKIVLGSSATIQRFGDITNIIQKDGFKIYKKVYNQIDSDTPSGMAKTTALLIIEMTNILEQLKPDYVVSIADRYENLAQVIAASYLNIPVIHTQGGEVTGSIDESVRHAITKLSHLHFPATKKAKKNLIKMGEDPTKVFNVGCPSIDPIYKLNKKLDKKFFQRNAGTGDVIDVSRPYITVIQHPVTTEYGRGVDQIKETLKAVKNLNMQIVWLWPNIDAGTDQISKVLRLFRDRKIKNSKSIFHFYKNFRDKDYIKLLYNTKCIIGNSSSAIREGSVLGVPAVNIGSRQQFREREKNIIDVDYNSSEIFKAIKKQLSKKKKYKPSFLYGKGNAAKKMIKIILKTKVNIQKRLFYK